MGRRNRMTLRALIIDDDPHIADVVSDIVTSLGHASDAVGCQDEARQRLATTAYDYFVLDLEIPVRAERSLARLQNGMNLLSELVASRLGPVIVVTGFGNNGPDQGVACVKLGAADYIAKPFDRGIRSLDSAILEALSKVGKYNPTPVDRKPTSPPRPFPGGEMQLLKKRLVLCGVEVPLSPLMHRILAVLSEKTAAGKYAAFSGDELAEHDGVRCNRGQNGISETIHLLRKRISAAVLRDAHIEVGDQDIIRSKGLGYRISDAITVVVGARRPALVTAGEFENISNDPDQSGHDPDDVPVSGRNVPDRDPDVPVNVPDLSDRQQWIMSLIGKGTEVRIGMVVEHFRCSEKTAKRDLSELKERRLIRFVGSPRTGHYRLM
ncbi:MAG: response regulator [Nevskiaceae bacterium]|nr:MAG: response regulator [Nevskiaceae bacterium]